MRRTFLVISFLISAFLMGCSSNSVHLTAIQVTPATPSIAAGLSQQFQATGMYSNNTTQDLTATAMWSSSSTSVATISTGGLATTKTAGSTMITASQSGVNGSTMLQVTAPTLVSIAVTPATPSMPLGTFLQFTATGTYTDGSTQNLTSSVAWSSTAASVASISTGGLATGANLGSTTIEATYQSVNGSTQLTVASATLVSLEIPGGDVTIANGTSHLFVALGIYNDGSRHDLSNEVTWGSSQQSVATISDGRATSTGLGSTSITATLDSISATAVTLTVTNATVTSIVVAPSSTTIPPLTQKSFAAIGTFSDGSTQNITHDVTWSSSAVGVAMVSNAAGTIGIATAVSHGSTNIIASLAGISGQAPLSVSNATLSSITLSPSTQGMAVGSTLAMDAVGYFSDGTHEPIGNVATWSTSASGVATVSLGTVTAVATGQATIGALLGTVSQSATITVEGLNSIAVTPSPLSFAADTSSFLTATGKLADGTTQDLTGSMIWTSSNPTDLLMSVASGSKGWAIGEAAGSAMVGAAFLGLVQPEQVTVTSATLSTITLKPLNATITLGTSQQFSAQGEFSDGTTQNLTQQVTWSSSDISVAILNASGAASTTGIGTTTIQATMGAVTASTTLTVQP
jgi:trimeric autotransporter adhesin